MYPGELGAKLNKQVRKPAPRGQYTILCPSVPLDMPWARALGSVAWRRAIMACQFAHLLNVLSEIREFLCKSTDME